MGVLNNIKNFFYPITPVPMKGGINGGGAKNLPSYIAPIRFERVTVDIDTWRDAVREAENQILPYRVMMQRIYADTYLNGHTHAAWEKRKNLTLLKEFGIFQGEKEDLKTAEFLNKPWFKLLLNYCMDAKAFGYTLVGLGNYENNGFPNIRLIKRENVSPDRLTISPITYSPMGWVYFLDPNSKDESGLSYYDWSVYVETPSETGQSRCGYGLLYKVALYEIYLRHNLADNATYNEMFGQPYRVVKTDKTQDNEVAPLDKAMENMGSSGWARIGLNDEIQFLNEGGGGNGYKSYESFEQRLQKLISKIILGHSDAMDSTPGKLGSQQGEESPVYQALEDIQSIDTDFLENIVNDQIFPKLQKIGVPIPMGAKFRVKNNSEKDEIRNKEDKSNKATADIALTLKNAGLKMDPKYFFERTGIPVEAIEQPDFNKNISPELQEKIKNIYNEV